MSFASRPVRLFAAFVTLLAATAAGAQTREIKAESPTVPYVLDARQMVVVDPFGLCWRTPNWTPALAAAGGPNGAGCQCDRILLPKEACEPPKPVAAAAPPPPPPVAPAAPAAPKTCNFTAVIAPYPFGSADLTASEKAMIDEKVLPGLAKCATVSIILVQGHTDRLGSQSYNQKLSERRAEAVVAYLKSRGVKAEFDAMGMGKTVPAKACPEPSAQGEIKTRAQLIECLAPNRRTVVEVKGTAK